MSRENVRRAETLKKQSDMPVTTSHEIMKPKWTRLEYVWQIDNFWEIRALASIEALDDDGGDIIWSQRFGDEERGIWRLKCYPYGDSSTPGKSNVSLFLSLDSESCSGMSAYAIFGCSILDDSGEKIPGSGRSYTRQKFSAGSDSWGWSQFIKVEGHSLSRMLAYGQQSLVVRCEVDVFLGLERCPGFDMPVPRSLKEDIVAFSSNRDNCDVLVKYGKGGMESYYANSFVLSARSTFFRNLLKNQTPTEKENCTSIPPPPPAKSHPSYPMNEYESDDEFGSFEDEVVKEGALYPRQNSLKSRKKKPRMVAASTASDVHSAVVVPVTAVATISDVQEDGRRVITIDPVFEPEPVLQLLTHIHVGENAFTSPRLVSFPAVGSSLLQVAQLAQLAHRTGTTSLYWEAIQNMAGRMITKEDAMVCAVVAQEIECKQLETHARTLTVGCFRNPDKDELMKVILPKSAQEPFRTAMRSGQRTRRLRHQSDEE